MYHLELRKFPHVVCRFNQSEAQLHALVGPWTRQEWIEEGERKWNVNEATLTILEGPRLSMPELAMGKGWRNAQKRSEDVTERVLGTAERGGGEAQEQRGAPPVAAAVAAAGDGTGTGTGQEAAVAPLAQSGETPNGRDGARDLDLLADSLGLELLALLDSGPVAPSRVWLMAQGRLRERGAVASAADALLLAERAVGSLLERRLAVLRGEGADVGDGQAESQRQAVGDGQAAAGRQGGAEVLLPEPQATVLAAVETWAGGGPPAVVIARNG